MKPEPPDLEIEKIQKKLIEITKRWIDILGYCKPFEPSLSITLDNEMNWRAEIYSYVMDFHDGGRHHYFEAKTFAELIEKIWKAIKEEEKKLKEVEISKNKS